VRDVVVCVSACGAGDPGLILRGDIKFFFF